MVEKKNLKGLRENIYLNAKKEVDPNILNVS